MLLYDYRCLLLLFVYVRAVYLTTPLGTQASEWWGRGRRARGQVGVISHKIKLGATGDTDKVQVRSCNTKRADSWSSTSPLLFHMGGQCLFAQGKAFSYAPRLTFGLSRSVERHASRSVQREGVSTVYRTDDTLPLLASSPVFLQHTSM
jgi:hypothetical protein